MSDPSTENFIGRLFIALIVTVIVCTVMTIPIWLLWNWVMPIVGIVRLTLAQAWGMTALVRLMITPANTEK